MVRIPLLELASLGSPRLAELLRVELLHAAVGSPAEGAELHQLEDLQPELEVEAGQLADLHQPRLQRVQLRPGLLQRGAALLEVVTQLRQPHHEAGLVRRSGLGQQVQGVVELSYC